ncbi:hypothetical protein [Dyadobacter bucti]|uniref:hypothetical protein n=1 Tax=Dyadobacter bucti TaxID=2572203 RepID=UPI0011081E91|nr:hypothetical protein [Dyadobacter bucti]
MAFSEMGILVALLTGFVHIFWMIYAKWKQEADKYLTKIEHFETELLDNRHRVIDLTRINGFPIREVIYITSIDGINIFYHFDSYQFLPDFLPNEDIMKDMIQATHKFLETKTPPNSLENAIELIAEYYDNFPDSEAHLYRQDVFDKKPFVLHS